VIAAPTAAELLGEDPNAKKVVKAKHAKNVVAGIANILATFNNTQVTITDAQTNATRSMPELDARCGIFSGPAPET